MVCMHVMLDGMCVTGVMFWYVEDLDGILIEWSTC
jgi:hypothetical protein